MARIFLLSPAHCGGNRARLILSDRATFDLAVRLRTAAGAPLGEVFSFLSGLYFRGKLAYARRFADAGVFAITPCDGLLSVDTPMTRATIRRFAKVDVDPGNAAYRRPLESSARTIARRLDAAAEVVLLGSIASPKYVDVMQDIFGRHLVFPIDFVGRGDMSRGGLLLRAAAAGRELAYVPVAGAIRHGQRPPKLDPATRVRQPAV